MSEVPLYMFKYLHLTPGPDSGLGTVKMFRFHSRASTSMTFSRKPSAKLCTEGVYTYISFIYVYKGTESYIGGMGLAINGIQE